MKRENYNVDTNEKRELKFTEPILTSNNGISGWIAAALSYLLVWTALNGLQTNLFSYLEHRYGWGRTHAAMLQVSTVPYKLIEGARVL